MKTVLVLSILLCAAFAAPQPEGEKTNEAKAPEAAVEVLKEEIVAAPEMDKMMKDEEVLVPEEFDPVPRNARYNLCPRGWEQYGSRCFTVISTFMSWYNAKEYCHSLGAHLASASNTAEYSFLQQMTELRRLQSAWLGGFFLQAQWMWLDREGFNSLYPVSSSYPCIYLRTSYGWTHSACSATHPFICSKIPENC